jgi:hypothetical protein
MRAPGSEGVAAAVTGAFVVAVAVSSVTEGRVNWASVAGVRSESPVRKLSRSLGHDAAPDRRLGGRPLSP